MFSFMLSLSYVLHSLYWISQIFPLLHRTYRRQGRDCCFFPISYSLLVLALLILESSWHSAICPLLCPNILKTKSLENIYIYRSFTYEMNSSIFLWRRWARRIIFDFINKIVIIFSQFVSNTSRRSISFYIEFCWLVSSDSWCLFGNLYYSVNWRFSICCIYSGFSLRMIYKMISMTCIFIWRWRTCNSTFHWFI